LNGIFSSTQNYHKKLCIADAGVIRYSEKNDFIKNMKSSRLRLLFAQNHPGLEMHMQLLLAEDSSALLLLFIDCLSEIKLSRV